MIGIFDSGFGGLSVLKSVLRDLPEHDYIYLGDNARAPYGVKSQEVIYEYTKEAVDFLFGQGADLIILACNTASSQALRKIQQEYLPEKYIDKNVLGVIRPLVERVAEDEGIKKVGVVGTSATIKSGAYKKELKKIISTSGLKIYQKETPLLVPLIEEGWAKKRETKMILKKYLRSLKQVDVQSLILGCTHYSFLLKEIRQIMPKTCQVYNLGDVVSTSLKRYLEKHKEFSNVSGNRVRKYFTTDDVKRFKEIGEKFLEEKIITIKKTEL